MSKVGPGVLNPGSLDDVHSEGMLGYVRMAEMCRNYAGFLAVATEQQKEHLPRKVRPRLLAGEQVLTWLLAADPAKHGFPLFREQWLHSSQTAL